MDEKKIRKAVQMLHIEKKECKKILDFHGNKQWNSGILRRKIEDCNTAIEALEKQLPKKPTYEGDGYAPDGTFIWDEWLCPNCGSRYEVDYDDYSYCPNCGQRIDREEEEEL